MSEIAAWKRQRNATWAQVKWMFTTEKASGAEHIQGVYWLALTTLSRIAALPSLIDCARNSVPLLLLLWTIMG